jgi:hypothetical protein
MAEEGINQGGASPSASASATPPPHPPVEEQEEETRSGPAAQINAGKRARGRPVGSKNKPKPPICITRESDSAMKTIAIEIPLGGDIIKTVADVALSRRIGICILSCSGAVANVSFLASASSHAHASTYTLHGRFNILSLSATFLINPIAPPPSQPSSSSLPSPMKLPITITIAGANGQVMGGKVAGALIAASPVVVVAMTFKHTSFLRLQSEREETNEANPIVVGADARNANMAMPVYGAPAPSTINRQLPPSNMPWIPTSRPHPYM